MYSEEKHETKENTMIKFEEHEGQLFSMLESPVPLTPDAEMPCLVRFIQDDSRMGMFNRDTKPSRLSDFYLVARIVSNNIIVDEFMESDYHRYEIIGTPVAEGSAEWALYHAINGETVTMDDCGIYKIQDGKLWECFPNDSNEWRVVADGGCGYWLEYIHDNTGWQIYKEPKEEPQPAKEPIANCENCKHVCTNSNIDHCHMYEPKLESQYKVGDWVEVKETATGEIEHHTVESINTFCPVSPEYLVDDVWFNHDGMEIIPLDFMFNHRRITRKLDPSEVVIPVNISGTVRQAYNEDGTINYEQFQLLPNGSWDGTEMFISFDALDTQTRELVESLLEAQEEE